MKSQIIHLLLGICYLLLAGIAQAALQSPEEVVRTTSGGVINRVEQERDMLEEHPEQLYNLINEFVIPHFDFDSMCKWILGKSWKSATQTQRTNFTEQFRTLMVRTYARALLKYSGQEIRYFPTEQKPNSKLAVVKTELTRPNSKPLPIAYRMYQKDNIWKVIDVAVDGVSLVSTYRGSFTTQIKKNNLDFLIKELTNKNKKMNN